MESMSSEASRDLQWGYVLLRVVLGTNILMHGVARLLAGPSLFAMKVVTQFEATFLPRSLVYVFGMSLPWVEAMLGLLLLAGLRTRAAVIAGGLLILTLTFGSCLVQDWNAAGSQLVYALAYAGLLAFHRYNAWSADGAMGLR